MSDEKKRDVFDLLAEAVGFHAEARLRLNFLHEKIATLKRQIAQAEEEANQLSQRILIHAAEVARYARELLGSK